MGRRAFVLATAVVWHAAASARAQADLRPLLERVPDAAVAVVAAADPAAAFRTVTALLEPLPPGLPPAVVARLGVGITALRVLFDGPTAPWLQRLAGGGAVVAWLPGTADAGGELLVVTRPGDAAAADAWCARHAGSVQRALVGDQLLLATTADGIERLRAATTGSGGRWARTELATSPPAAPAVAALVDLAALRRWLGPRLPDPGRLPGAARFVFGPIVAALGAAPWLRLDALAREPRLRLELRADASGREGPSGALLAHGAPAAARPPLAADGLLSLTLDRSLHALLAAPERCLGPDDVQAVRGFLSIADALDGPRSSFVDDLLGGLREPFTVQVLPPAPDDDAAVRTPIVLPEFVVVAEVATEAAADGLFRTAQLLAGIVNAERAQRGQAPFLVRWRQDASGHGLVAEPPPWRGPGAAPLDRQLSPTLWLGGGRIALASTQRAAQAMVAPGAGPCAPVAGDQLVLRGPAIGAAIDGSRRALVFDRMMDAGDDADEAGQFLTAVSAFAAAVAELRLAVTFAPAATGVVLELERRR